MNSNQGFGNQVVKARLVIRLKGVHKVPDPGLRLSLDVELFVLK